MSEDDWVEQNVSKLAKEIFRNVNKIINKWNKNKII